ALPTSPTGWWRRPSAGCCPRTGWGGRNSANSRFIAAGSIRTRPSNPRPSRSPRCRSRAPRPRPPDRGELVTENAAVTDIEDAPSEYTSESVAPTGQGTSRTAPGAALGRRKKAVVRVRLVPGEGTWTINGRSLESYFPNKLHQQSVRAPLSAVDVEGRFDVIARIDGGGSS